MRLFSHNSDFHLTYCSNTHPAESWSEVNANLQYYIPQLKQALAPEQPFGIGLRLSDPASRELLQDDRLAEFKAWLMTEQLYVFTLNGFPYGGFHGQVVKDQVYCPDWRESDRWQYTRRLVQVLAELLPDGMEGSISTLPLSYKPWFAADAQQMAKTLQDCALALAQLTIELAKLQAQTGRLIHLGLEPEPDGLLENTAEVIDFFTDYLRPLGSSVLAQKLGTSEAEAVECLNKHIRVCYDTCHFAIAYEDPAIAFQQLKNAEIQISKIQLSSALKVPIPTLKTERQAIAQRLADFTESTYLHQVVARQSDGNLRQYRDLDQALPELLITDAIEWRVHFHIPIFLQDDPLWRSTQDHLLATLTHLQSSPLTSHLEIETYTWEVLPDDIKLDLAASIQQEYQWVLQQFSSDIRCDAASPLPISHSVT
jgi:hypothetical protein